MWAIAQSYSFHFFLHWSDCCHNPPHKIAIPLSANNVKFIVSRYLMWRKRYSMTNNIEIFKNEEFGEIRTVTIDGEPWFVAKDIASILEYKDLKNTVKNRCKRGRVSEIPHPQNSEKSLEVMVIPESDIYRLIIGSKLPSAQKSES